MAALTTAGNAQVLMSKMLDGYKEGDKLEKSVYASKEDPCNTGKWCGAFSSNSTAAPNPLIGKALTYDGYPEGGPSITFGGFEAKRGARFSVYSLTEGRQYGKGVFYLSCLVNFTSVSTGLADFLGASPSYVGGGNRANIYVRRGYDGKIAFGVGLLKVKVETTTQYDLNKTHLLVAKIDYDAQKVSLFVDPKLGSTEPSTPDAVAAGDDVSKLKAAIRGITFRNRTGIDGCVGSIRWSKSWDGVYAQ